MRISRGMGRCRSRAVAAAIATATATAGPVFTPQRGLHVLRRWQKVPPDPPRDSRHWAAALFGRAAAPGAPPSSPLQTQSRHQGSLNKMLEDPNDVFLAAIMAYDIPRIAELAAQDPDPADDGLHLHLLGPARTPAPQLDTATRKHADLAASPPSLSRREAKTPGEAVLQSLYASGLDKLAEQKSNERAQAAALRAVYNDLSDAAKQQLRLARVARHRWDAVCAVNAILRTRVEALPDADGATAADERGHSSSGSEGAGATSGMAPVTGQKAKKLPDEDLQAIGSVYDMVQEMAGHVPSEQWESDFVPELEEVAHFMRAMGADWSLRRR